ncbi:ATP-binding protein [Paraburkholderia sediminicola]|uniref:ATP-binding protein n=1 Tax=Paraburkholderia sediminicola TaxID=458836 RepID=UPI0038BB03D4
MIEMRDFAKTARKFTGSVLSRLFIMYLILLFASSCCSVIFYRLIGINVLAPRYMPITGGGYYWFVSFSILGTSLIAAWFAARLVARPFRLLAEGANKLAVNIDSAALPEIGPSEAREAARVCNQMQLAIKRQMKERSRFLAAISHDIRTPLTRMKLRLQSVSDKSLRERLSDDMNEMTQLLDATLSYLRDEEVEETIRPTDVESIAGAIADDASDAGHNVTVSGTAAPIAAQPLALKRCIENLVSNAVRYGNVAHVNLFDSRDQLIITVVDDGPGIPDHQLQAVFEPFYRVEGSRSRDTGGVGLGLSIASEIATRHGGTLQLENVRPKGLRARIVFPRDQG